MDPNRLPAEQRLRLGDVVRHTTHVHEPSVREPALRLIPSGSPDVLVVSKAASLPVHACGRFRRNTLVHILGERAAEWGGRQGEEGGGLRTVHRLDRVTSGVVIFARTAAAARALSDQIKAKQLRKEYVALVHGAFPDAEAFAATAGIITATTACCRMITLWIR
jgi:23S rRNA-/tRNA-specific pseudouridylate synthase